MDFDDPEFNPYLQENPGTDFAEDSGYCNPNLMKVIDIDEPRLTLPTTSQGRIDLKKAAMLVKQLVGKDLSRYSLPCFLNEPLTILQKSAEFLAFADLLTDASKESDPYKRMVLVAAMHAGAQWLVNGRTSKPFISLLGETYELITDKYRFFGESVSQHPPILAIVAQGDGWSLHKNINAKMHFTGMQVQIKDSNIGTVELEVKGSDGKIAQEEYKVQTPMMIVGNLLVPSKTFIEASGKQVISNEAAGVVAEINFMDRGWLSDYYTNRVEGEIKDTATNEVRYKLEGYYTSEIYSIDVATEERTLVFKAPKHLDYRKDIYGMNALSLQLNQLSDDLKAKLPPTDCRLRPDLRLWEEKDSD